MAGRSDVKIGSNLKDAIPKRFRHMVTHLKTADHKEMMNVLNRKFGTKNLGINDIIGQLESLKVINTDKMFIDLWRNFRR